MESEEPLKEIHGTCPTPTELGHSGWNILHSSAAMFPHNPSPEQRDAFSKLMYGWSHLYACSHCAYHMRRYLAKNPPIVSDKFSASRYMCEFHNVVNLSVGKSVYDCDPMVVLRRWHPTFPDMEDQPTVEEQILEQKRLDARAIVEKQRQREAEEERLAAIGGGPQRRSAEEWREVNSKVGTFASGWSSSQRSSESPSQTEAIAAGTQQQQQEKRKKWWFFGGSAVRRDVTVDDVRVTKHTRASETLLGTTGAANTARAEPVKASGISEKAADDEKDVSAILKRLKACMVYCPEQDKEKKKVAIMGPHSAKRMIVRDGVFYAELFEFLKRELADDGFAGVEHRVTPQRTEITIHATKTREVNGEKGRRVRELTACLQQRFKYKEGKLQIFVDRVEVRGLSAMAQCESLRFKLLSNLQVRRAAMGIIRFVMESGAKGCEVTVGGKIKGQRAKSMTFRDGYMIKSGTAHKHFVDSATRHCHLRAGTIGVKVKIMLPVQTPSDASTAAEQLPDVITVIEPKEIPV